MNKIRHCFKGRIADSTHPIGAQLSKYNEQFPHVTYARCLFRWPHVSSKIPDAFGCHSHPAVGSGSQGLEDLELALRRCKNEVRAVGWSDLRKSHSKKWDKPFWGTH